LREEHPVILTTQTHKQLVFIHPFADGNGRVTRLVMNTLLIQKGFLPVIIPPILRSDYITALEIAHNNDSEFIDFILIREIETQKEMLRLLKGKN
jgi:Fic family protein